MKRIAISDVATLFSGISTYGLDKMGEADNGVPLLNIRDIIDGTIRLERMPRYSRSGIKGINQYLAQSGDVVVTCRGTALKVAAVPEAGEPVLISANLIGLRMTGTVSGQFLAMYLRSAAGQRELRHHATTTTGQLVLRVEDVAKVRVPVLPAELQEKLVKLWTAMEDQYRSHLASAELCRQVGEQALAKALAKALHDYQEESGG